MALSLKQELFVKAYLSNGGNATQAAKTAGYAGNLQTLQSVGKENLGKPLIAHQVRLGVADKAETIKKTAEALGITPAKILEAYSSTAFNPLDRQKVKALDSLSKILALMPDKLELTGAGGGAVQIVVEVPSNGREVKPDADSK